MNKSPSETLPPDYFERIYANNLDPWNFETSEYELAKYQSTIAALPQTNYQNAFEIGCSIGVLTEKLAARCKRLLSVDVSEAALEKAEKRCAALPHIEFKKLQIPAQFPNKTFDLILISEVGYYLSIDDWQMATEKIVAGLNTKGHAILVHWTPFVDDYPQTGDAVHNNFKNWTIDKLKHLEKQQTENYRLDVFEKI